MDQNLFLAQDFSWMRCCSGAIGAFESWVDSLKTSGAAARLNYLFKSRLSCVRQFWVMLRHVRTTAAEELQRGMMFVGQCLFWAVCVDGPETLDFNGFSNGQGIFKFNAKISDRAVHFCVPQQKLNGAKVACFLVDLSDLRAPH